MGDCVREMIGEVEEVQHSIKNFSVRVDGLSDDLVLWAAEELIRDIRRMIDTKKCVNEELGYNLY